MEKNQLFSLIIFFFFSLLILTFSLPSKTIILDAIEILADHGFLSMSLTLGLVSDSLTLQPQLLTVFSPADNSFVVSGQPSLSLLKFHLSPLSFSLHSLKSLPTGTRIPTLLPNHFLTVTSSTSQGDHFSLNGVKIDGSPTYDDGSLVIFEIKEFFNPNFESSRKVQNPTLNLGCEKSNNMRLGFKEASEVLRSRNYNLMASFLDSQLLGDEGQRLFTVFAPIDKLMIWYMGNYTYSSSVFLRHIVPCKVSYSDLSNFGDGAVLESYLDGFEIHVVKYGNVLLMNGVPILFPNLYKNDWLVVHGLLGIFKVPKRHGVSGKPLHWEKSFNKENHNDLEDGEF